jgi:photosystem II stability/assembly factor-like uncharacterized protein
MKKILLSKILTLFMMNIATAQWKYVTPPTFAQPAPEFSNWYFADLLILNKDTMLCRSGTSYITSQYNNSNTALCKSTDGGITWQKKYELVLRNVPQPYVLTNIAGEIYQLPNQYFITRNRGFSSDLGETWDTITSSSIFSDLRIQSDHRRQIDKLHFDSVFYTDEESPGSNNNKILYKTSNLGISKQIVMDSLLGRSAGLKYFNLNKDTLWILRRMSDNLSMAPNESYRSNYGRLFRSTNGGQSWTYIPNNIDTTTGTFDAVKLFFVSIDTGFMGVNRVFDPFNPNRPSTLYRTTDGGRNWFTINTMNLASIFSSIYFINSKVGFAYGGGKAVMKTIDGGFTWFEQITIPAGSYSEMGMAKDGTIYVKLSLGGGYYFTTTQGDNKTVGIDENKVELQLQSFKVYPNPTEDRNVSVAWLSESMSEATIKVFDLFGRLIYTTSMIPNNVEVVHPISLNAASGIYIVRVEQGGRTNAKSIVLK